MAKKKDTKKVEEEEVKEFVEKEIDKSIGEKPVEETPEVEEPKTEETQQEIKQTEVESPKMKETPGNEAKVDETQINAPVEAEQSIKPASPSATPTETKEEKPVGRSVAAATRDEGAEEVGQLTQLVLFALGGEEYGVEISEVREIIKTEDVTSVPNAPPFIRGIINVRGKIVTVIDLEKRFLLEREEEFVGEHILIAEMEDGTFGLMVDEVSEVLRVPEKSIKPAPSIISKKIHAQYLKGVVTLKERLIILLDLSKVLSEEELSKLSEQVGKYSRKIKPKSAKGADGDVAEAAAIKENQNREEFEKKGEIMAEQIENE